MIDIIDAKILAKTHVLALQAPAEGYRIGLGDIRKVENGWYFNYKIACVLDIPEAEQEKFAGAFGFVVNSETSEISEVSYQGWVDLGLSFHNDPYGEDGE